MKNEDFKIGIDEASGMYDIILNLMLKDFMIATGPMEFLKEIEMNVYPPSTKMNNGFVLINAPGNYFYVFALIKKTDRLKKAFGNPDDFKYLLGLQAIEPGPGDSYITTRTGTVGYKYKNQKDKEKHIRDFVFDFLKNVEEVTKTGDLEGPTMGELIKSSKSKTKPKSNKRKSLTKSIRHEVFVRDEYKCVECGATKESVTLHVDHIIPVAQGGTDELSNLQTLCEACNLSKSNRAWKSKK